MDFNEWHEQAAQAAFKAFSTRSVWATGAFSDLSEHDQESWRAVARAVLGEGKIEFRQPAELAELETREENQRLRKIVRDWQHVAIAYREQFAQQESVNAGLRRAYKHACEQRDKYQRRAVEWRQAALDGTATPVACTGCANGCKACDPMEGRNHV